MAVTPRTIVAKAKTTLPANMDAMFAQDVEALRERLQVPTGDRIKIDNKQFKLPNGETLDFLDIVIVDYVHANRFYDSIYDKTKIVPPACFSTNAHPVDMVPSPNSPEPQATDCSSCPQNQFGTAGKGKACKNRILMAILPTDATVMTPFTILDISPTAVKGFIAYTNSVAKGLGRPPYGVVTHVECNKALKEDVAVFSDPIKIEDSDFILMLRGRLEEARARLLVDPDVTGYDAPQASKLPAPRTSARRPAAARK